MYKVRCSYVYFLLLFSFMHVDSGYGQVKTGCREQMLNLDVNTKKISLRYGQTLLLRPAVTADAPHVTALIHRSFEVWKQMGLKLSPMAQTEKETSAHLVGKGYIATTPQGKIVGTYSLDEGSLAYEVPGRLIFYDGGEAIEFMTSEPSLKTGSYLVFKKLAVDPSFGRFGIGLALYQNAESVARSQKYAGILLETVREASWLYDWYLKIGFSVIGTHRYPGSQVDTVLMLKTL
jgi:predicted N-acetyltransferase YhbS